MKRLLSIAKITLALLMLLFFAVWVSNMLVERSFKEKFQQIKSGMRVEQVISTMGVPEQISYNDDSTRQYYWYSSEIIGKSTEPWITFDSTETVIGINYGD